MQNDLIIHNGTILTVNPKFDIIPNGIICIRQGKIHSVEAFSPSSNSLPEAARFIDAKGGIIMPGLVNTHTHLPMTLFRGLADDLPLADWLNHHIFPAESNYLNPTSVFYASLLACTEMILSGTTTCCDGYFFEDDVAKAVQISGMRAILGHGLVDFPAPGVPDPSENISTAVSFAKRWKNVSPLIQPSLFCHSPYTCSGDTLKGAKEAARSEEILFQIHIAETKWEYQQMLSTQGASPIQYLDQLEILDRDTLLVHAVWNEKKEADIIKQSRSAVSHNPESNMKLGSGIAPIPEFINAGIPVGLGTDGCASNNSLDLFQAMDAAAKLHKVQMQDPTVMDARTVIKTATVLGAEAIGLDHITGSIEAGKEADIIILDICQPHLTPIYHPESHVVYSANGADVRDVIISGRPVMEKRKLLTLDLPGISQKVKDIAETIKKRPTL